MEEFLNHLLELATKVGSKIILALVVYIVGSLLIKSLIKALNKNTKLTAKVEGAVKSFALSFIKIGLYVLLVISIIGILGVPMAFRHHGSGFRWCSCRSCFAGRIGKSCRRHYDNRLQAFQKGRLC